MKVLLNGGIARHGIDILSQRFGDHISLPQTAETDATWTMAENMKWAEALISVDYGP
jgi:hydrogenase maturation factor